MLDTAKLSEIISAIKLRNGTAIGPPKKIVLTASDDAIEPTEELRHQLFSEIQLEDGPLKSPCWIFLGIQNSSGYGQLLRKGEFIAAHRVSWVIHNGPIPDGLWVLHACDQPSCCAPDQLWLGSHQENMRTWLLKIVGVRVGRRLLLRLISGEHGGGYSHAQSRRRHTQIR